MAEITIDRKKIAIDDGATILEAARAGGIHIPTLCYHAQLSPVGSCRVCLVEVDGATDPVASCNTRVRDGMVVKTNSARIRKMRRAMVELVLVDHPLECPVCDKAGECELQDIVYELGITEREFEPVGTVREVNEINHFIGRYPSRCILCGRCVRACENVQGASVMSYVQRNGYTGEVAVVNRDTIECEQCGQCLRVCPVGALIEQPFKYRARAWELTKTRTTCPHCGVGCTLILNTKGEKIYRVTSDADSLTGGNLCVRGRFGWDFVDSDSRLTTPMVRKNGKLVPASWDEALDLVAEKLDFAKRATGAGSIAVFGSTRCTNEDNYQLQKFARGVLGTNNIAFSDRAAYGNTLAGVADVLGVATAATNSLAAVEQVDAVLVLDADVSEVNPMFSLRIQNAARRNAAKLIVADSRRTKLARYAGSWLPIAAGSESIVLGAIVRRVCENERVTSGVEPASQIAMLAESLADCTLEAAEEASGVEASRIAAAADVFASARSGAVIVSGLAGREIGRLAADLAVLTGNVETQGGVYAIGLANNWQGASDMGVSPSTLPGGAEVGDAGVRARFEDVWGCDVPATAGLGAVEMMTAAAAGAIAAAYVMGDNPTAAFPNAAEALSNVKFLVVQDILRGPLAEVADVVLPAASFAEKRGTFTNMERCVQRVRPAIRPRGEARSDAWIVAEVAARMGVEMTAAPSEIMAEIAGLCPAYAHVNYEGLERGPVRWPAAKSGEGGAEALFADGFADGFPKLSPASVTPAPATDEEYAYRLVVGERRFHSGTMSRFAKGLSEVYSEPLLEVSPEDAAALGVKDAAKVALTSPHARMEAKVKVTGKSLPGTVFLPFGFAEVPVAKLLGWNGSGRATKAAIKIERV